MVTIDNSKCTSCGRCISICHENCITHIKNGVEITYDVCSTCGQCIAICPARVFGWDGDAAVPFDNNLLPSSQQVDELLRQRRTIRYFKPEKPDRQLVEEIVQYGSYAPAHNHEFRVIAVENDSLLKQIDGAVFQNLKKIYKYLFRNPLIRLFISRMSGPFLLLGNMKKYTQQWE